MPICDRTLLMLTMCTVFWGCVDANASDPAGAGDEARTSALASRRRTGLPTGRPAGAPQPKIISRATPGGPNVDSPIPFVLPTHPVQRNPVVSAETSTGPALPLTDIQLPPAASAAVTCRPAPALKLGSPRKRPPLRRVAPVEASRLAARQCSCRARWRPTRRTRRVVP